MRNVQNYWWILNAAIDQRRASRHTFSYDLPCMKLKTMKDSTLVLVSFRGVLHNEQQWIKIIPRPFCPILQSIHNNPCRFKSSKVFLGMTFPRLSSNSSSCSGFHLSCSLLDLSFCQRATASSMEVTLAKWAVLGMPKQRIPWACRHSAKWRWKALGPRYVCRGIKKFRCEEKT